MTEMPYKIWADNQRRWYCPEPGQPWAAIGISYTRTDRFARLETVCEAMETALQSCQASFELMLDSAGEKTDLTNEGLANLFNVSISASLEALQSYEAYKQERG